MSSATPSDLPASGLVAEARFRPKSAWPLLDAHVNAVVRNPAPDGSFTCDAARARRLYDEWIAPRAAEEDVEEEGDRVDKCHAAFLGALLAYIQQAVAANTDSRTAAFVSIRHVLLTLLRDFAALKERPLGERPDFTRHVSAQLSTQKSPSTHLAVAVLFKAGYIPHVWPAADEDPIFESIRKQYPPADLSIDWETDEARRLFQSASYYLVHGGPHCPQQILAGLSGVGSGEAAAAAASRATLYEALEKYRETTESRHMENKREGWTLLNLVWAAREVVRQ